MQMTVKSERGGSIKDSKDLMRYLLNEEEERLKLRLDQVEAQRKEYLFNTTDIHSRILSIRKE